MRHRRKARQLSRTRPHRRAMQRNKDTTLILHQRIRTKEANAKELNGVSFDKGCYVGQENTARMNYRGKVNRRLVVVPTDSAGPRTRSHYPQLGLAVEHRRIDDLEGAIIPGWLAPALAEKTAPAP